MLGPAVTASSSARSLTLHDGPSTRSAHSELALTILAKPAAVFGVTRALSGGSGTSERIVIPCPFLQRVGSRYEPVNVAPAASRISSPGFAAASTACRLRPAATLTVRRTGKSHVALGVARGSSGAGTPASADTARGAGATPTSVGAADGGGGPAECADADAAGTVNARVAVAVRPNESRTVRRTVRPPPWGYVNENAASVAAQFGMAPQSHS